MVDGKKKGQYREAVDHLIDSLSYQAGRTQHRRASCITRQFLRLELKCAARGARRGSNLLVIDRPHFDALSFATVAVIVFTVTYQAFSNLARHF
jgi:hypothetical protein